MTTAQDLIVTTLDVTSHPPVEQGNLSLALAGAELIDLIEAEALTVDGDRLVPGPRSPSGGRLLNEAAAALVGQAPYETVTDWLWRRGRGLSAVYFAGLETDGQVAEQHNRWIPLRSERHVLVDSPERRRAADRWASREPVLTGLAAAAGIHDEPTESLEDLGSGAVVTVLAAVHDAVQELEAVRQRRAVEDAAFDNIWRGQ